MEKKDLRITDQKIMKTKHVIDEMNNLLSDIRELERTDSKIHLTSPDYIRFEGISVNSKTTQKLLEALVSDLRNAVNITVSPYLRKLYRELEKLDGSLKLEKTKSEEVSDKSK